MNYNDKKERVWNKVADEVDGIVSDTCIKLAYDNYSLGMNRYNRDSVLNDSNYIRFCKECGLNMREITSLTNIVYDEYYQDSRV